MDTVVIPRRFNGPPDSANGGYTAGLLGRALPGVSEVTLPREWGDWATRASMPSLRLPDFHMSSVSQAQ